MASSVVSSLIEKLNALLVSEVQLLAGVSEEVEDLKEELTTMRAFLNDADRRGENEVINKWVRQVRDAAYDADDILDKFTIQLGEHHRHGIRKLNIIPRHNIANEIQAIKRRISCISARKESYSLSGNAEACTSSHLAATTQNRRREMHFVEEGNIVGIEKEIQLLVERCIGGESKTLKIQTISVVGMGGSGKTTLVGKVYHDPEVKGHFDCAAWVSVSQSFDTNDLLKRLLKEFRKGEMALEGLGEEINESSERVFSYLKEKKYLIVLDDIWSLEAWAGIKLAFPKNSKSSTILITSRNEDLPAAIESDLEITNSLFPVKPLEKDTARALFCKNAFRGSETCPPELTEVCNRMVDKCEGLPLAIVGLGSLMSRRQKIVGEWLKVYDSLPWHLESKPSLAQVKSILTLSYNDLPSHLKPCFLYCAMFPENYLINRNRLIRQWIAEALVRERVGATLEQVGEEWLAELIARNMLKVERTTVNGRVRTCRLHHLVRDMAVSKSVTEEFALTIEREGSIKISGNYRRLSILRINKTDGLSSLKMPHLRSLLVFDDSITKNFFCCRLLRVLDLQAAAISQVDVVVKLLHLRYLGLRDTMVERLPDSLGKLQNLQTLDIRGTRISRMPEGLLKIKSLRHMCLCHSRVKDCARHLGGEKLGDLGSLQTLSGIRGDERHIIEKVIGRLRGLERFEIYSVKGEDMVPLCTSIQKMEKLERLKIHSSEYLQVQLLASAPPPLLTTILLVGPMGRLPLGLQSLSNLTRLHLESSRLIEDPFISLQGLPNLLRLTLLNAYEGQELLAHARGFPRIKMLALIELNELERVVLEEGAMPNLEVLRIYSCGKLGEVPLGIQWLSKLQELLLMHMPREFMNRLRRDGGEDYRVVQHVPKTWLCHTQGGRSYRGRRLQ